MEETGKRASLVLFAPLLDVAHRLELNRSDRLSVRKGSCIANSRHFSCFLFFFLFFRLPLHPPPLFLHPSFSSTNCLQTTDFALIMVLLVRTNWARRRKATRARFAEFLLVPGFYQEEFFFNGDSVFPVRFDCLIPYRVNKFYSACDFERTCVPRGRGIEKIENNGESREKLFYLSITVDWETSCNVTHYRVILECVIIFTEIF